MNVIYISCLNVLALTIHFLGSFFCSEVCKVHSQQALGRGRIGRWVSPGVRLCHIREGLWIQGTRGLHTVRGSPSHTLVHPHCIGWQIDQALGLGEGLDLLSDIWGALPLCDAFGIQSQGQWFICKCISWWNPEGKKFISIPLNSQVQQALVYLFLDHEITLTFYC